MDRTLAARLLQDALSGPRSLFAWIGWALLAGAFFLALRADEARREWIRVEGTIIDYTDGETDAPIVEYQAPTGETRTVTGQVSSNPRAGKVGDRVPVLINPENPDIVRLGTPLELWFAPGILGGIGGVFVVIGTLAAGGAGAGRLPGQLSARRVQTLRETGERVMARVTAILAQGANPATRAAAHWRIQAVWRDGGGAARTFISQPIGVDPSPHVKVGDEIGVYIDRDNPKVYAFDFSMLPFGEGRPS
jgi:hypothetical protein